MSKVIAALLMVAAQCISVQAEPELWGSRVITTPSGPSPSMTFDFQDGDDIYTKIDGQSGLKDIKIDKTTSQCMQEGKVWGSPCRIDGNKVTLTAGDVTAQSKLIVENFTKTLMAVFVPNNVFPKPNPGYVVIEASLPLSIFAKNMKSVAVNFAVQGASSTDRVYLDRNGRVICTFTSLQSSDPACENMVADTTADMRRLKHTITQEAEKETLLWFNDHSSVAVNVDWTPDDSVETITTATAAPDQATTTSAVSTVILKVEAILGLLVMMLFLGN